MVDGSQSGWIVWIGDYLMISDTEIVCGVLRNRLPISLPGRLQSTPNVFGEGDR